MESRVTSSSIVGKKVTRWVTRLTQDFYTLSSILKGFSPGVTHVTRFFNLLVMGEKYKKIVSLSSASVLNPLGCKEWLCPVRGHLG